jgi:hypothetical protein
MLFYGKKAGRNAGCVCLRAAYNGYRGSRAVRRIDRHLDGLRE